MPDTGSSPQNAYAATWTERSRRHKRDQGQPPTHSVDSGCFLSSRYTLYTQAGCRLSPSSRSQMSLPCLSGLRDRLERKSIYPSRSLHLQDAKDDKRGLTRAATASRHTPGFSLMSLVASHSLATRRREVLKSVPIAPPAGPACCRMLSLALQCSKGLEECVLLM
eukprot:3016425-Rhodomonas_salina.1